MNMDEVIQVVKDEIDGREPSILGAEADQVRRITRRDMEICRRNGWVLDIPHELVNPGDIDENGIDQALVRERRRIC